MKLPLLALVAIACLAACAPTTVSPLSADQEVTLDGKVVITHLTPSQGAAGNITRIIDYEARAVCYLFERPQPDISCVRLHF